MIHPSTRRQFLQDGIALTLSASGVSCRGPGVVEDDRPSFLFIMADDLGYADLSCFGQTDYQTPNLDRLAREGTRLTHAYANSPVCSATRFALITGRYQYRLRGGLEEPIAKAAEHAGLPPEHPTLPSLLRQAGYATALFGKWHLGYLPWFGPLKSGYEVFFGNYGGAIDYFTHKLGVGQAAIPDLYEGETPVEKAGYYTDLISERAIDYLKQRQRDPGKPFLLSLHYTAPHWPWEGPKDETVSRGLTGMKHYDGGSLEAYAEMVRTLDAAIGRVLAELEKSGRAGNTVVVFTSDNGGERFSKTWPLSGQKSELLEGGIRVPTIVRYPGRIPAGRTTTQTAMSMDWLPTLLAAAGAPTDHEHPPDGVNLLDVLTGKSSDFERTLFWRYKGNDQEAVRSGKWKYLKIAGDEFLFDIVADPRERASLALRHPDVLTDLKSRYAAWNAQMLPIVPDSFTDCFSPGIQADHYGMRR